MQNSTGPMTRDELMALANAPYGAAAKAIRQHDPLWGRTAGETINWRVQVKGLATVTGYATVEAATEEEALEAVESLDSDDIEWDDFDDPDDFSAEEATPE